MTDMTTIRRTIRKHRERILNLPNVTTIGIGKKSKNEENTDAIAICIYVSNKLDVKKSDRIPCRLRAIGPDGVVLDYYIPTDVILLPEPMHASPFAGGQSIICNGEGSAGVAYKAISGSSFLLTNSHVVAIPGQSALEKIVFDDQVTSIGKVVRFTEIDPAVTNRFDGALITPTNPKGFDLLKLVGLDGSISGVTRIVRGSSEPHFLMFGGNRLECTFPSIIEVPTSFIFPGGISVNFTAYYLFQMTHGDAEPGQSGSLLFKMQGGDILGCGVVFGRSSNSLIAVIPLQPLLTELGKASSADNGAENVDMSFDNDQ